MKNEIIQVVACNGYDGFAHITCIFSKKNCFTILKII